MSKNNKNRDIIDGMDNNAHTNNNMPDDSPEVEVLDVIDPEEAQEASQSGQPSEFDTLKEQLNEANAALEKEKKEYLFLMADFDNFRKRVLKEKADLLKNAAEKTLKGLLPIVDDFERGLEATKDSSDSAAVRQGMELIYNKLVKYLSDNGVNPMDSNGASFDPEIHEAVAMVPAQSNDQKGIIIDTTQKGYTINDKVLRHAKVVVAQ